MWPTFQLGDVSCPTWRYALWVGAALRYNSLCLGASQLSGRLHAARRTGNIRSTSRRHPSDCYSYAHTYTHADCDYSRRHAADANGDRAHLYSNAYTDRDRNAYHQPRPDADVHADRHRHIAAPYSNANRESERTAFGYASATICNADRNAAAAICDTPADRDASADCNAAAAICDAAAAYSNCSGKYLAVDCAVVCDVVVCAAITGTTISVKNLLALVELFMRVGTLIHTSPCTDACLILSMPYC